MPSVLLASSTDAAFSPDQLTCRAALSKSGIKLGSTASKAYSDCHKKRSAGKLSATLDCNAKADADHGGRIDRAAAKLLSQAQVRCVGSVPGDAAITSIGGCP